MLCKGGWLGPCLQVRHRRGTTVCLQGRHFSLRTLFEFTDSCRYCNICFSAGYEYGKVGKGLRGQFSAPRAHNLLDGRIGLDGGTESCVDLIDSREGGYSAIYNRCVYSLTDALPV
jgi:hypothetical protein